LALRRDRSSCSRTNDRTDRGATATADYATDNRASRAAKDGATERVLS
jgi:hypothetical protein